MKLSRRSRWAVPAGAVVVTGAAIAAVPALAALTNAQAAPALPAKTPAQLLAQVASANQPPPMSGTVTETVSLGLPKLPDTGAVNSPTSLLTGSHTLNLWYDGPKQYRIALPQQMRETDIYRDGGTAWLWQSSDNAVTKFVLPARAGAAHALPSPAATPLTPQQAATEALALAGKSTTVTVAPNVTVAGRAAYDLSLQPKNSGSLIGQVTIAIDASTSVPLQVQVFARGAASPAISVGFTHVSFATPAASDLTFTPPPTAKVTTTDLSGASAGHAAAGGPADSGAATTGSGWLTVAEFPSAALQGMMGQNPAQASGAGLQGASAKETQAAIIALFNHATPVSGAWGSGTLLRTSLLSVLMTNGKVYAGAVDPSVLYAAAAAGS